MGDIAGFLGSFPPFDAVGADDLARIAAVTETEVVPRGKTIFSQGAGPVEYLWVVRSGSVEIIHDGRVLDLLGPGELFGHASMISGLPTGFEARAAEDTVCYRIPADVMRPLLALPDVLRFVARSIVHRAVTTAPAGDLRDRPGAEPGRHADQDAAAGVPGQRAHPRGGQADDRPGRERGTSAPRRIVRHRDRSGPADTGDRGGPQPGRAGLRDHDRARLHRDR